MSAVLRRALERIATHPADISGAQDMVRIAREALAAKPDGERPVLERGGDLDAQDYVYTGDGAGFWIECGPVVLYITFDYDGDITVEALPTSDADGTPLGKLYVQASAVGSA